MVHFEYIISDPMGLHARPAGVLVKKLKPLACNVIISCGERKADAKALLALMGTGIKYGETVTVTIEGENEEAVKEDLITFFQNNF